MRMIEELLQEAIHNEESGREEIESIDNIVKDQLKWEDRAYNKGLRNGLAIGAMGVLVTAVVLKTK